ncbi:MAG: oligoendopeptidase F family protein, partial [Mycoplasma sp.]|nr:oligoendopeptidase F family protein [Mycoplasma sp.]
TWAKVLNYKNSIDYLTFSDNINEQFLETLYSVVKEQKDVFKPYFSYYKKFYKKKFNEKISDYDWNRDLIKVKNRFSIEETQKLVLDSLKPFDKEYYDIAKNALLKDKWVDYFPNLNKKSGAYSIGSTFGIDKKLISMNFDYTFSSIETLAHELGHSMHSYFSDKNNSLNHSQYPIFLAEIASIFNELLLYDHLLKTSDDDKLKFYILTKSINGFMSTVYRQVEWSNYEYELYKLIDSGQALNTYDALSDLYYKNNIKYSFSKKPKPKDKNKLLFWSIRVPHFYYDFYVYKYAIGQLVANIFFQKYKLSGETFLKEYIDLFLKKGGSNYSLAILKESNIDLNDKATYLIGFDSIKEKIKLWVKLGKKIFNI